MSYFPQEILSNLQYKYRDSSISIYEYYIKNAITKISGLSDFDISVLENDSKIREYLSTLEKNASKRDFLNSLIAILNAVILVDHELIKKYQELLKIHSAEAKKDTYSKERKLPEGSKIKNLLDLELKMKSEKDPLKKLILGLYAYMPILRTEEWTSLKHYEGEKDVGNYINMKEWIIVIKEYKTSETYGERRLKIPEELRGIMVKSGEYLLMKGGRRVSSLELRRILKSELGISNNELRRMYISETVPYLTKIERMKLCEKMGHSIEMQEFVYYREGVKGNEGVLRRLRWELGEGGE